ncbi:hypothetical protein OG242_12685 [Streptomyces sp. NBC_00727]|uniref:hypothetical protein n=1 Tax=Streptomyces sp. NBC_00727 TaxID=2903675 RepID=UPI003870848D
MLDSDGAGVSDVRVGPGFRIAGKLARRGSPVHATDHCVALLYVKIVADPFTGCLTSRWDWSVTLNPQVSARIRRYRPRLPPERWGPVADQVRATVAAAAPATCYEAGHLLHVVGRLAVWADSCGLPRDPGLWLRTETIDLFILRGLTGRVGSSRQTFRTWLRRTREALVWVERGEAPAVRISANRRPQPPYELSELARLGGWAELLPGRARLDGLAMMALTAGCGLNPGELPTVRGSDLRITDSGMVVIDAPWLGRLVACRAEWEATLAELAQIAGNSYLFRPGRKVEAAKNLVSSWPARHRPHAGLPPLSARRLRTTWIVDLLRQRIDPALVAQAAGMNSAASLGPYFHWVPPLAPEQAAELLRGQNR